LLAIFSQAKSFRGENSDHAEILEGNPATALIADWHSTATGELIRCA
jgi:hypothetical protein